MTHLPSKQFNTYKEGLDLELLREYCMEYGERRSFLHGETLEAMGESAQWVAYVERGYFKYMVHNGEEGKDYCTGFAFEGEVRCRLPELSLWQDFRGDYCGWDIMQSVPNPRQRFVFIAGVCQYERPQTSHI